MGQCLSVHDSDQGAQDRLQCRRTTSTPPGCQGSTLKQQLCSVQTSTAPSSFTHLRAVAAGERSGCADRAPAPPRRELECLLQAVCDAFAVPASIVCLIHSDNHCWLHKSVGLSRCTTASGDSNHCPAGTPAPAQQQPCQAVAGEGSNHHAKEGSCHRAAGDTDADMLPGLYGVMSRWSTSCAANTHPHTVVCEDITADDQADSEPWQALGMASYAAAPMMSSSGHALGWLCVADSQPRRFDAGMCRVLNNFGELAVRILERHVLLVHRLDAAHIHVPRQLRRLWAAAAGSSADVTPADNAGSGQPAPGPLHGGLYDYLARSSSNGCSSFQTGLPCSVSTAHPAAVPLLQGPQPSTAASGQQQEPSAMSTCQLLQQLVEEGPAGVPQAGSDEDLILRTGSGASIAWEEGCGAADMYIDIAHGSWQKPGADGGARQAPPAAQQLVLGEPGVLPQGGGPSLTVKDLQPLDKWPFPPPMPVAIPLLSPSRFDKRSLLGGPTGQHFLHPGSECRGYSFDTLMRESLMIGWQESGCGSARGVLGGQASGSPAMGAPEQALMMNAFRRLLRSQHQVLQACVLIVDTRQPGWRVLYADKTWRWWSGYSRDAILGKPLASFIMPASEGCAAPRWESLARKAQACKRFILPGMCAVAPLDMGTDMQTAAGPSAQSNLGSNLTLGRNSGTGCSGAALGGSGPSARQPKVPFCGTLDEEDDSNAHDLEPSVAPPAPAVHQAACGEPSVPPPAPAPAVHQAACGQRTLSICMPDSNVQLLATGTGSAWQGLDMLLEEEGQKPLWDMDQAATGGHFSADHAAAGFPYGQPWAASGYGPPVHGPATKGPLTAACISEKTSILLARVAQMEAAAAAPVHLPSSALCPLTTSQAPLGPLSTSLWSQPQGSQPGGVGSVQSSQHAAPAAPAPPARVISQPSTLTAPTTTSGSAPLQLLAPGRPGSFISGTAGSVSGSMAHLPLEPLGVERKPALTRGCLGQHFDLSFRPIALDLLDRDTLPSGIPSHLRMTTDPSVSGLYAVRLHQQGVLPTPPDPLAPNGKLLWGGGSSLPARLAAEVFPDLQLDHLLGRGGYGVVFHGVWHDAEVVLKMQDVDMSKPLAVASAQLEVCLGQRVSHPNIVRTLTHATLELPGPPAPTTSQHPSTRAASRPHCSEVRVDGRALAPRAPRKASSQLHARSHQGVCRPAALPVPPARMSVGALQRPRRQGSEPMHASPPLLDAAAPAPSSNAAALGGRSMQPSRGMLPGSSAERSTLVLPAATSHRLGRPPQEAEASAGGEACSQSLDTTALMQVLMPGQHLVPLGPSSHTGGCEVVSLGLEPGDVGLLQPMAGLLTVDRPDTNCSGFCFDLQHCDSGECTVEDLLPSKQQDVPLPKTCVGRWLDDDDDAIAAGGGTQGSRRGSVHAARTHCAPQAPHAEHCSSCNCRQPCCRLATPGLRQQPCQLDAAPAAYGCDCGCGTGLHLNEIWSNMPALGYAANPVHITALDGPGMQAPAALEPAATAASSLAGRGSTACRAAPVVPLVAPLAWPAVRGLPSGNTPRWELLEDQDVTAAAPPPDAAGQPAAKAAVADPTDTVGPAIAQVASRLAGLAAASPPARTTGTACGASQGAQGLPAATVASSVPAVQAPPPPPARLRLLMIHEFCDGGSLQNTIDKGWLRHGALDKGSPVDMRKLLSVACDMAAGLAFLHGCGIIHADLSASNVLLCNMSGGGVLDAASGPGGHAFSPATAGDEVQPHAGSPAGGSVSLSGCIRPSDLQDATSRYLATQYVAKIADFGKSVLCSCTPGGDPCVLVDSYATVTYMAPEVLTRKLLSPQADVYSLGVLLWQMLTGSHPWSGCTHQQVVHLVGSQQGHLAWPQVHVTGPEPTMPTHMPGKPCACGTHTGRCSSHQGHLGQGSAMAAGAMSVEAVGVGAPVAGASSTTQHFSQWGSVAQVEGVVALGRACLHPDRLQRPSAAQVLTRLQALLHEDGTGTSPNGPCSITLADLAAVGPDVACRAGCRQSSSFSLARS